MEVKLSYLSQGTFLIGIISPISLLSVFHIVTTDDLGFLTMDEKDFVDNANALGISEP
jgi:hypothetical protein